MGSFPGGVVGDSQKMLLNRFQLRIHSRIDAAERGTNDASAFLNRCVGDDLQFGLRVDARYEFILRSLHECKLLWGYA